jgi:hypothetical protein
MKNKIYIQIGIMGWNDGMCMKKRIIEPNFIPSLREISTSFFPFLPHPNFFLSHSKGGPCHHFSPHSSSFQMLVNQLKIYSSTWKPQNNMKLMRK